MRPALARVPGVGHVEVLASDTREIEVIVDPGAADRRRPDGRRRRRRAEGGEPAAAGRPLRRRRACSTSCSRRGCGSRSTRSRQTPVVGQGRRDASACRDVGTVRPGAPDRTVLVTGNGRDAADISVSQQIGANILDVERGVEEALGELARDAAGRPHAHEGLRPRRVRRRRAIANVRDAILIGGLLAVIVLLVFLRDWRLTLVAAITLPLAVIPTFVVMRLLRRDRST